MTPCEERGWKVGDLFRLTTTTSMLDVSLNEGLIVQLVYDDGSYLPFFLAVFGKAFHNKPIPVWVAEAAPHLLYDCIIHIDKLQKLENQP